MAQFDTRVSAGPRSAITPARLAAARVMRDLRSGGMLDSALDGAAVALDTRDRRWLQELVFVTLRRRAWIDAVLDARVRGGLARLHPDLCELLRLGVTQLVYMGSVPAYAAIAQTVEQAKAGFGLGASKLANAVLRRVDRERGELEPAAPSDPIDAMALTYSHPRWLVARWVARWGEDVTRRLLEMNNTEAHTILRPMGLVREQLEAMLEAADVQTFETPLAAASLGLPHGVSVVALGAFQHGHCFVQDPAATLVTQYAAIAPGSVVADLCAAPGGKAFELARTAGAVFAADASFARLQRVTESTARMELRNVFCVVADGRFPAVRHADVVLLDAPCTGTGTFRRHPDARWRIRASDLPVMAAVQRSLLESAARVVAPGGLLVYSTCSLELEENDAQVEAFLEEHPEFALEPPPAGTLPTSVLDAGRLRVTPQSHGTDGAFAARLRRRSG